MFTITQRNVFLLQLLIMPLWNGVVLKIALPQGGILMFGESYTRFGGPSNHAESSRTYNLSS